MTDKDNVIPFAHIDSSTQHPDIPEAGPTHCPECKVEAECGFGMAGGGMGVYTYCPSCGKMLSKIQTED
jgi:hypothetical protein